MVRVLPLTLKSPQERAGQECIPVGCVPSVPVATSGSRRGIPLVLGGGGGGVVFASGLVVTTIYQHTQHHAPFHQNPPFMIPPL